MAELHDEQLYGISNLDSIYPVVDVENNLTSDSTTRPLAAYQGKVLKELIDNLHNCSLSVVDELPATGENWILYLVPNSSSEDNNIYDEYVWVESEAKFEKLGTFGITVDDILDTDSENPVQNKVIAEAIVRLNREVFPLSVSVSGGGVYEIGTSQTITVSWTVRQGSETCTPDTLTVNGESVTTTDTSRAFTGVTSTTTYTVAVTKDGDSASGSTTATFVYASYFGAVAADFVPTTDNFSTIEALTKSVKNTRSYTGTVTLTNQKSCYAYPQSFGTLSAIKDANNFEYINSYTRYDITNSEGVAYYVYVLTDPTTISSFQQIYS